MKFSVVAVAKFIIPIGLLLLGVNGMMEVRLQHDMDQKAVSLKQNVSQAKTLSGQLGQGLQGLGQLEQTTKHMQSSLAQIQQSSLNMAEGLGTLSQTVAGINQSVAAIGSGVGQSQAYIHSISQSELGILGTLQHLNQVNSDIVQNLGTMLADEGSIHNDLVQINQKTALVP
ncbi:hypothetical protein JZ785_27230 [Alicyclobacillus curvatus]|jgi:methyl-accepting chemotaxis protein|nr:hypothetical protein JZ785_27230 [Alicyclobacillus curvatus]